MSLPINNVPPGLLGLLAPPPQGQTPAGGNQPINLLPPGFASSVPTPQGQVQPNQPVSLDPSSGVMAGQDPNQNQGQDPNQGQPQRSQYAAHHSGIQGVARDILGTLGDFVLKHAGLQPMYWPAQMKHQLADATQNYGTDPLGSIAQVRQINPVMAQQMEQQYYQDQDSTTNQQSVQNQRQALVDKLKQDAQDKTDKIGYGILNTANEQNFPAVKDRYESFYKAKGQEPPVKLGDKYDSTINDIARGNGMSVAEQEKANDNSEYHQMMETIARGNLGVHQQVANQTGTHYSNEDSNNSKPKPVGSYTGSDGNHYTMFSDGSNIKGPVPVLPKTPTNRMAPPAPVEGEKRTIGGKTYVWRNGHAEPL